AIFTDLKILLFPVRASEGTFKWVTCERVLERFKKDFEIVYGSKPFIPELNLTKEKEDIPDPLISSEDYIILEDFIFNKPVIKKDDKEKTFLCNYPEIKLKEIIKIGEDYFDYLVSHATQIIARNKLNDNKTSENLWYEEFIPTDTVMYSFVMPSVACNEDQLKSFASDGKDFCSTLDEEIIQIGGGETVGKGIVKFSKVTDCEDENADS
ncbi:MAG: type III-B CRISPR module RAMP protein Cmr4, partial [bacterium]